MIRRLTILLLIVGSLFADTPINTNAYGIPFFVVAYAWIGIGIILLINLGLGIAWQSNYNANGMLIAGSVCYSGVTFAGLSLSYQWRLGKSSNFFSLGVNSNYHFDELEGDEKPYGFFPVISFDRRF